MANREHWAFGMLRHQENYEEAFAYYYQAVKLNPNLLLAQFGLAQMYIHRGPSLPVLCRPNVRAAVA